MPLILPIFVGIGIYPYMELAVNILLSNRWIGKLDPSAKWKHLSGYLEEPG
jgi:hypothetical protein